jgi:hypothetical protein
VDGETMTVLPDDLEEVEGVSNFDGIVPDGLEEKLRTGKVWCAHPAWDHWGAIWFADGKFHEMVKQYRVHVATVSGDTLREVLDEVNERFGCR